MIMLARSKYKNNNTRVMRLKSNFTTPVKVKEQEIEDWIDSHICDEDITYRKGKAKAQFKMFKKICSSSKLFIITRVNYTTA